MKATIIIVAAVAILAGGMLSALAHDLPTQKPVNLPAQKPVNLPAQKPVNLPTQKKVIPYNPRYDHYSHRHHYKYVEHRLGRPLAWPYHQTNLDSPDCDDI